MMIHIARDAQGSSYVPNLVRSGRPKSNWAAIVLLAVIASLSFPMTLGAVDDTVPPLVGLHREDAVWVLHKFGFKDSVVERYDEVIAPMIVVDQTPPKYSSYATGRTVVLWVSLGQRPQPGPDSVERLLEKANIILSEVNPAQVRIWLRDDPAYQALAGYCLDVLAGRRVLDPIPLDVINGRYKEQLGFPPGYYLTADKYKPDDNLRTAIFRAWQERHSNTTKSSFAEIVK